MRPQPTLLSGMLNPTMSLSVEAIPAALRSAALGVNAFAPTGAPVGYQPSVKYWRMSAVAPAIAGVAMLVPERDWKPVSLAPDADESGFAGAKIVGLRRPSSVGPRLVTV